MARAVSRPSSPRRLRCLRCVCLALVVGLAASGTAFAQEPAKEFWPEVDAWWRTSPVWRLSLFVPISKNLDTHYREGNLIAQADFAWGKTDFVRERRLLDEGRAGSMKVMLVRGGYLGGRSLDDHGEAYTERTAFAELHVRLPIRGGILLSHRLRTDLRWLGENAEFSNRWRYRLMAEREFTAGRVSFVPYVNVEPDDDSRYNTVNRIRLIPGASVARSRHTAIEGNVTYQDDSRSSVTHVLALNVILHVFIDTSLYSVAARKEGRSRRTGRLGTGQQRAGGQGWHGRRQCRCR